jgi:uncharacterized coiled-coil protein SlyX
MTFPMFLETLKYLWIPLLGFAYKTYSAAQEKQDKKTEELEKRAFELEKKVSHQMTKQDVIEVVNNAVEKLTLKIDKDFLKIDNGVHKITSQFCGKESTLIELLSVVSKLEKHLNEKE